MTANVSRETFPKLAELESMVRKWSSRINLVSRGDLQAIWDRHIIDSVQVFDTAPPAKTWLDFGSGAGFPGLVCAVLAADAKVSTRFTLVESDARKTAFLREASRVLALDITIITARLEEITPTPFDVITARAVAPLPKLLGLAHPFTQSSTTCLFPKGSQAESELTPAATDWHTQVERVPSRTNPDAAILKITELAPIS